MSPSTFWPIEFRRLATIVLDINVSVPNQTQMQYSRQPNPEWLSAMNAKIRIPILTILLMSITLQNIRGADDEQSRKVDAHIAKAKEYYQKSDWTKSIQ